MPLLKPHMLYLRAQFLAVYPFVTQGKCLTALIFSLRKMLACMRNQIKSSRTEIETFTFTQIITSCVWAGRTETLFQLQNIYIPNFCLGNALGSGLSLWLYGYSVAEILLFLVECIGLFHILWVITGWLSQGRISSEPTQEHSGNK